MSFIIDLETNGFLKECNQIHCMGVSDFNNEASRLFLNNDILEFLEMIRTGTPNILIGHNIFGFDLRVINKIYRIDLTKTNVIHDTFIMSQVLFGDLKDRDFKNDKLPKKYIGSHSLAAWGHRLGVYKGEYDGGFDNYNDEMGKYCLQDCIVTKELYKYLTNVISERTWK